MNTTSKDYFTFNVHNSALIVGQSGTGKTDLVRSYLGRLEQSFTPEQMRYVIYDLKQVEFNPASEYGAKLAYLYAPVLYGTDADMDYLEELAHLAIERAKADTAVPLLVIYIEECDMACQYPGRFHRAVMTINHYAKAANMKLLFSTSRPAPEILPPEFIANFDLILAGHLASETDERTIGVPSTAALGAHDFYVKEQL